MSTQDKDNFTQFDPKAREIIMPVVEGIRIPLLVDSRICELEEIKCIP